MITRRSLLKAAGTSAILVGGSHEFSRTVVSEAKAQAATLSLPTQLPEGTRQEAVLDALPGKQPLIKLAYRPPNYETPIELLRTAITPNDAFFVRYHLSDIPQINAQTWRLAIGGEGAGREMSLTFDELRQLPAVEVAAVCQCSGNRRGLFDPHVPGVEWGYGAMGCARWRGARLKDVLDRAGLKSEALEIVVAGTDNGAVDKTPQFVKSIPLWKAIEDTTLIAYEMNGAPLPHWNGFPARIIVPGWTATYWMKHVSKVDVVTRPFEGFWMKSAYRIPLGKFPVVSRFASQETAANTPITEMVVNSLMTSHTDGATVRAGSKVTVGGVAWDAGYGIDRVEMSTDGGGTWTAAALGEDLGRFAFRTFSYDVATPTKGSYRIMARATNRIGQSQVSALIANPAGYHHNVVQTLNLIAA
ncbi:MAG TPA: molybdopterin-dependent oxidoreductase [Xanthobacteraceae bacterium]|jgi:DMSO/TMAO reductase YedYZ molybdopterin-dependent catalytic subunit|nr:molybdopterin-dependent oxidoreductase [Xanthobacteraceae bacterium]